MPSPVPRVTLRQDLQRSSFSTTTEGLITLQQVPYTGLGDVVASSAFVAFLVIVTGFGSWMVIQRGLPAGRLGGWNRLMPAFAGMQKAARTPTANARPDPLQDLIAVAIAEDVWLSRDTLEAIAARAGGNMDLAKRMVPHCVALVRTWFPDACKDGMISSEAIEAVLDAAG
ncbi:hypothetical protein C4552_00890 [Candidatus Parcubacteria bacterium]|nr:MAG: hypothetical protein C4552_00890 [Candidatus Parcubacteria bacterium]